MCCIEFVLLLRDSSDTVGTCFTIARILLRWVSGWRECEISCDTTTTVPVLVCASQRWGVPLYEIRWMFMMCVSDGVSTKEYSAPSCSPCLPSFSSLWRSLVIGLSAVSSSTHPHARCICLLATGGDRNHPDEEVPVQPSALAQADGTRAYP